MESANLHHHHHHQHQLQDQLVGSSSLSTPSWYGAPTNHHTWSPNTTTLNTSNFNDNINEDIICNTRDSRQKHDILVPPAAISSNSSMIQDLGFQYWTSTNSSGNCFTTTHDQSDCFPKFTQMMINSSSGGEDHLHNNLPAPTTRCYTKNEQKDHFNDHLSEKLLLKTLSSSAFEISGGHNLVSGGDLFQYNNAQNNNCSSFGGGGGGSGNNIPSRGSFSQIFPSINISNLSSTTSRSSSDISSSINMNLEALDLLTSARFSGTFTDPSHDNLGLLKEFPYAPHHMQQQPVHRPPSSPSYKISPFISGEAKRTSNTIMDPKSSEAASKKSRMETRACPPFKVRKEKLGDRIAALQQLVAPFGKTDTASVLMEAIGYIKFLQNQVETLSVPYMKSSRNKTHRTPQYAQSESDGNEEPKRDLRSRGLCLVPLSCMSYVTNDGGGCCGIWPHAEYHGCT